MERWIIYKGATAGWVWGKQGKFWLHMKLDCFPEGRDMQIGQS